MDNVLFNPEEHSYAAKDTGRIYPSVTKILQYFRMTPDYDAFGNETAKNFGTAGHKLLHLYDTNDLGEYDPAMEPWLRGYKKFLESYAVRWELLEQPMISHLWGFAGTPDRVGQVKSRNAAVDFKFGEDIPAHALQTAGYEILYEENVKVSKIKERYTLLLLPDDFRLIPHTEKSDKIIFLGLVNAYTWGQRKGVIQ